MLFQPLISIVVCTYNNAHLLSHCLDSLVSQTLEKDLYQVIVVDNNSKDNTQQMVKRYLEDHSNFSLTSEINQGLSYARNKGWKVAQGKYIAFLDDDAKATQNWCQKIIKAFENVFPTPIAVGGSIYPWYETNPPKWFSDDLEIRSWGKKAQFLKGTRAKFGFSGSNMAFPRKILEKYGGFSSKFGRIGNKLRVGEDTELFFRIHKEEPYFWYDPHIKVFHWTPINKMRLKYRAHRSYRSGLELALMEKSKISVINYLKTWIRFILFLLKIPYSVFKPQKNKKIYHIRLIEQLAFWFGSLIKQSQLLHPNMK